MAKAICIVKMKTGAQTRGQLDAGAAGSAVNFEHCGVDLPGNYQAYIVTGTGAQLTAITQHANFVAGQQIQKNGEVWAWADSRTKIAAGALTKINTYLVANGHEAMTAQNSIVDLLRVFKADYEPGQDDVFDAN